MSDVNPPSQTMPGGGCRGCPGTAQTGTRRAEDPLATVRCWEPIPEPQRLILLNFSILNILISLTLISALPKPVLFVHVEGHTCTIGFGGRNGDPAFCPPHCEIAAGPSRGRQRALHPRPRKRSQFCFRWMRHGRRHEIGLG